MSVQHRPPDRSDLFKQIEALAQQQHAPGAFIAGETPIPVTGKVYGPEEIVAGVRAVMDFWLTAGPETESFERALARRVGVRHALMCNSGSSANLLAISALTSPKLGSRRLKPGAEVITVAAGFPTTVAPILQNQLTPVFVDVEESTYGPTEEALREAVTGKTQAIVLAHCLGNPCNLDAVMDICSEHNLWFVEDSCDALGGAFKGRNLGTFGDLATVSFYPAHHITTGEGGAVFTKKPTLKRLIESFRDWGRDCWCLPGRDDTCGKRFGHCLGDLPAGYDHKYTYTHLGYNLKSGDVQAAIGLAQLERLDVFVERRKYNFNYLYRALGDLEEFLILPRATEGADPSWFGFPIMVREGGPRSRDEITRFLEGRRIGTRLLFGGNLLRQPAFRGVPHRTSGGLRVSDSIMQSAFWVGVWPGLTDQMLDFVASSIREALKSSP